MRSNLDDTVEIKTTEVQLTREMSTFHVALLGYGAMVGASIFVLAGISVRESGAGVLIAIFLNFLISVTTGYSY
ncbi:MAG TPA: hypothetical protein VJ044_05620, partial [Candidatus Hodarchaeales archaeon]|nr:hypothetical protein [Candidatus Hodarchaeales archaeon]